MRILCTLLLLASVLTISFVNRTWLGTGYYYLILFLMPVWGMGLWYSVSVVSSRAARRFVKESVEFDFTAYRAEAGSLIRGRMVFTATRICFVERDNSKHRPAPFRIGWSAPRDKVSGWSEGSVENKKGIIFSVEGEEVPFIADVDADRMNEALRLDRVSGGPSDAPDFNSIFT